MDLLNVVNVLATVAGGPGHTLTLRRVASVTQSASIEILLLVGGPHHDKEGARRALLDAIHAGAPQGARFQIEMTDDLSVLEPDRLQDFHVIANYTTGQKLTPSQGASLCAAVEAGTGFVGIHCATVTFRDTEQYNELIGSVFTHHPKFGEVSVQITDPSHPITHGLSDFTVPDELYVIQSVGGDFTRYHVLTTAVATGCADGSEMKDGVQPSTYLKEFGRGRVFYTSLGHDPRCFVSENFCAITGRGIAWAARLDLPVIPRATA